MPIYAYKCGACGFAKDVLQKMSDAPLTACPSCGKDAFSKQLTAAGFQLKGGGWYVTDFRGGSNGSGSSGSGSSGESGGGSPGEGGSTSGGGESGGGTAVASSASGHACGSGCGCA